MIKIDLRAELLKPHILPSSGSASPYLLKVRLKKKDIQVSKASILKTLLAMEEDGLVVTTHYGITRWMRTKRDYPFSPKQVEILERSGLTLD